MKIMALLQPTKIESGSTSKLLFGVVLFLLCGLGLWLYFALRNSPLSVSYAIENLNSHKIYSVLGWDIENDKSIFFPYTREDAALDEIHSGTSKGFSLYPKKLPINVLIEWETRHIQTKKHSKTVNLPSRCRR